MYVFSMYVLRVSIVLTVLAYHTAWASTAALDEIRSDVVKYIAPVP